MVMLTDRADIITNWIERHGGFFFILLAALYSLLFFPIWKPVLLGFLFASASGPLQSRLRRLLRSRRAPVAFGILVGVTLLVSGLVALLAVKTYLTLFQAFEKSDSIEQWSQTLIGLRNTVMVWLQERGILTSIDVHDQIDRVTTSVLEYARNFLLTGARNVLSATPQIVLNFTIFIMAFAAFLLMGLRVFASTATVLGFEGDFDRALNRFEKICALSLGSVILTGLVQATIVTTGALICSYGNYFLIFAATFIFALVPMMGGGVLPFVLGLIAFMQGDSNSGIILLVTGGISGLSDNVLKAWLFSKASATNPLISLISLIGGILLIGFAGLFVAPVIEQLLMAELRHRREAQVAGQ